ncbi:MAG: hypothetical protein RL367_2090 [Pseudomonadota bacterium]|jgi:hypothetical protein
MSQMALRFSRALEQGRKSPAPRQSREALLVTLLNKRAIARVMGAIEMEAMLREQILWALPTYRTSDLSQFQTRHAA